jgi:hypothetical protein
MTSSLKAAGYVSLSKIPPSGAGQAILSIVEQARDRNWAEGVTGGLLYSGERFAQYIEGPSASIDAIMQAIRGDDRHEQIFTFFDEPVEERKFEDWSLAYNGHSSYVNKQIAQMPEAAPGPEFARRSLAVFNLIHRFAGD